MQEMLKQLGDPHKKGHYFHVAGTNGKGSVAHILSALLSATGFQTGLFISPFVYDFRERIQINGKMISKKEIAKLTNRIIKIADCLENTKHGKPTEFEFKTAVGFVYWQEKECDVVVLEVGLGGRLDSTNVVTPEVAIVSEIALDHQNYLGETIEQIALEKAGIIKQNRPVVVGATNPIARNVLRQVAQERKAPIWMLGEDFKYKRYTNKVDIKTPFRTVKSIDFNLVGDHQARNLAVAITALDVSSYRIDDDIIRRTVPTISFNARLEKIASKPTVYLDGAHNPQAAEAAVSTLKELHQPLLLRLVYSAATGHQPEKTLLQYQPYTSHIHYAKLKSDRGLSVEELQDAIKKANLEELASLSKNMNLALKQALNHYKKGEVILITGSFYIPQEIKKTLDKIKDSISQATS